MTPKRFLALEWDAIAGVIAAVAAIMMHFLHLLNEETLITIAAILIALLFLRDLRRDSATEQAHASIAEIRSVLQAVQANLVPADAILIGPDRLLVASERFSTNAKGEMIWFHVCLSMFKPQPLFDVLLRPAIENPRVTSIQFILDENQKELWNSEVLPKVGSCKGKDKVKPPRWGKIQESVSVIISDVGSSGGAESLLSFWGEPFMAHTTERSVPRYIFHVQKHSELVTRLIELARTYRFSA
ncbi:MAG: hypothetical protein U1E25_11750 [Methylocystis sp.]